MNGTKTTSVQKSIHNFKEIVKGILWFCKHMQEKPEYPTEIQEWKVSLREMGNGELNTLVHQSIDNHPITEEKGVILTF